MADSRRSTTTSFSIVAFKIILCVHFGIIVATFVVVVLVASIAKWSALSKMFANVLNYELKLYLIS